MGTERKLTRKSFLRAGGGAVAGAYVLGLAGCGGNQGSSGTSSQVIRIPSSGARLPKGKASIHILDSDDLKTSFWEKVFTPVYKKEHPNITVNYDGLPWERINETVPVGIRNGTAPDLFALPQTVPGAQAVEQGWVAPLDDVIPNFKQWKANFPPNTFFEGVNVFNGKVYTFAPTSNRRDINLLLYNKDLMQKAGYDPSSNPLTWDDFRKATKKITKQGHGQYYGVMLSLAQPAINAAQVSSLAYRAGMPAMLDPAGGYLNQKTGDYSNYTSEEYLAVIDLYRALKSDGSVFPGSASLQAPEAYHRMPQGVAGTIIGGSWIFVEWQQQNSGFKFGVAREPVPGSGKPLPVGYSPANTTDAYWLYAKSKVKDVAGDILHYLGSPEGQIVWSELVVVATPPVFPHILSSGKPLVKKSISLAHQLGLKPKSTAAQKAIELSNQMLLYPDPVVRNPDVTKVYENLQAVSPLFGEVVQSIFVGDIKNPKKGMKDLRDRSERALDDAIKAAQKQGAKVSRDDFAFPNWNPRKNYTKQDYAKL